MDEIEDILLDNPIVLKHLGPEHIEGARKELLKGFMEELIKEFDGKWEGPEWYEKEKKKCWYYLSDLKCDLLKNGSSFRIDFRNYEDIYCGIHNSSGIDKETQEKIKKVFKNKDLVVTKSHGGCWIRNETQPSVFENKNALEITSILVEAKNKDGMKALVEETFNFINPYYQVWKDICEEQSKK